MSQFRPLVALSLSLAFACGGGGGSAGPDAASLDAGPPDGALSDPDAAPDTTAPKVLSVSPADQSSDVAGDVSIEIVFDEALAPGTVVIENFALSPTRYAGLSYDDLSFTVTLTTPQLYPGSEHTLSISGVTDPSGNLAANFASSFVTASAAALGPTRIDGGGSATHENPVVVYDSNGDGVAAWQINGQVRTSLSGPVAVSYYTQATDTWSPEVVFADMTSRPLLATDDAGVWLLVAGSDARKITLDLGTFVADVGVMQTTVGSPQGILCFGASYFAVYSAVTDKVAVYDYSTWSARVFPGTSLEVATDGTSFAASYVDQAASPDDVRLSAFLDGAWTAEVVVDPTANTDGAVESRIVAAPGGGGYLVAWGQNNLATASANEIYAALYSHDGVSLTLEQGPQVLATARGSLDGPTTLVTLPGEFLVPYEAASGEDIAVARSADAISWSTDVVYEGGSVRPGNVRVASDGARVLLTAIDSSTGVAVLHGAVYGSGVWGSSVQLSSGASNALDFGAVGHKAAQAADSRLAAIWRTDESPERIHLSVYDADFTSETLDTAMNGSNGPVATSTSDLVAAWSQDKSLLLRRGLNTVDLVTAAHEARVERPVSAASSTGLRVSAWRQSVGNGVQTFVSHAVAGAWSAPIALGPVMRLNESGSPRLAVLGDAAVVAWDNNGPWVSRFDGESWDTAEKIDSYGRSLQVVASDSSLWVGWLRAQNKDYAIRTRELAAGVWQEIDDVVISPENDELVGPTLFGGPLGVILFYQDVSGENFTSVHAGTSWASPTSIGFDFGPRDIRIAGRADRFGILHMDAGSLRFREAMAAGVTAPSAFASNHNGDDFFLVTNGTGYFAAWGDSADGALKRRLHDGTSWLAVEDVLAVNEEVGLGASSGAGYAHLYFDNDSQLFASVYDGTGWKPSTLDDTMELGSMQLMSVGTGYAAVYSLNGSGAGVLYRSYRADAWDAATSIASDVAPLNLWAYPTAGKSIVALWTTRSSYQLWGVLGVPH